MFKKTNSMANVLQKSNLSKEARLKLRNQLHRVSNLMRECSLNYQNAEHKSYRWNSLKNLKFKFQKALEPFEIELQNEYFVSETHKSLQATIGKSGFQILTQS